MKIISLLVVTNLISIIPTPSLAASQYARNYAQNALNSATEWAFQGHYEQRSARMYPYRERIFEACFYTDKYSDDVCIKAADDLMRLISY